jgi:ATP-dependent exoDNAse (exonuclease V) beta subunit
MSDRLRPVSVVTASAGTGKTYDLVSRIERAVADGRDPERILASTFTVKAAEELRERARGRLIAAGKGEQAIRLLGARIGTINSVSGGLVKEFAFGLGLSPIVDVLDEDAARRTFLAAASKAIGEYAEALGELTRIFGYDTIRPKGGGKPRDWRDDVIGLVALARANNLSERDLKACADRSVAGFRTIAPAIAAGESAASLDAALTEAIAALLALDPAGFGGGKAVTKTTLEALDVVRDFARAEVVDQPWHKWAKLSKLAAGARDRDAFAATIAAAATFPRHPRLVDQVESYVRGVFACAGEAMAAYDDHKRKWGLVDFVDQDRLALALIGKEEVRAQIGERVQAVFVDEFQDTSPLQLAVFIGLSQIAAESVWVGDPKQAIYGFRGADPELIAEVAESVRAATGGEKATLPKNYRSRPGLVSFFNDAFATSFEAAGLSPDAARVAETERVDLPGQSPPLGVWRLAGKKNDDRYAAVANGVVQAIAAGDAWKVADGAAARPLSAGDVAILCRANDACLAIAAALARAGLKVAIERGGLFGTPEARLALAALKWCADQRDSVALAELAQLLHDGEAQPAWFEASLGGDPTEAIVPLVPIAPRLVEVAAGGAHKTPLEFFDAVLTLGGVSQAVLRWGRAEDRRLNLEQLRGLVAAYQAEQGRERAPTTTTDLCAWLVEHDGNQPESRAPDAVAVATYHAAKGLEWPLVVLTDLDAEAKANPFGAHVESDRPWREVDWRDPLDGRWLRFWPWPFGAQKKDVGFDALASNSAEGRTAERKERAERIRLLYVGATRARDYLVLATPASTSALAWLDELRSADGAPAIALAAAGASSMRVGGNEHAVRAVDLAGAENQPLATVPPAYSRPVVAKRAFPPLAIRPSDEAGVEDARIVETFDLGARLPLVGQPDMTLVGEALHRFLAADDPAWSDDKRIALAARLLDAWGVVGFDPRDVVAMGGRFWRFVAGRWPNAKLRREAPINWRTGDHTLIGRLDLVIDAPSEMVVFDHKSFPGGRAQWFDQARKYAGQLRSYSEAVRVATAKPVRTALHLPIGGEVLFVE